MIGDVHEIEDDEESSCTSQFKVVENEEQESMHDVAAAGQYRAIACESVTIRR